MSTNLDDVAKVWKTRPTQLLADPTAARRLDVDVRRGSKGASKPVAAPLPLHDSPPPRNPKGEVGDTPREKEAEALGILQPLRDVRAADDTTLAAAIKWCVDNGAESVAEVRRPCCCSGRILPACILLSVYSMCLECVLFQVIKSGRLDELIAILQLKPLPAKKIKGMLQPTSSFASGELSYRTYRAPIAA